jgi:hypothetical protein
MSTDWYQYWQFGVLTEVSYLHPGIFRIINVGSRQPTGHPSNSGRATAPAPRCSGSWKRSESTHTIPTRPGPSSSTCAAENASTFAQGRQRPVRFSRSTTVRALTRSGVVKPTWRRCSNGSVDPTGFHVQESRNAVRNPSRPTRTAVGQERRFGPRLLTVRFALHCRHLACCREPRIRAIADVRCPAIMLCAV